MSTTTRTEELDMDTARVEEIIESSWPTDSLATMALTSRTGQVRKHEAKKEK